MYGSPVAFARTHPSDENSPMAKASMPNRIRPTGQPTSQSLVSLCFPWIKGISEDAGHRTFVK